MVSRRFAKPMPLTGLTGSSPVLSVISTVCLMVLHPVFIIKSLFKTPHKFLEEVFWKWFNI